VAEHAGTMRSLGRYVVQLLGRGEAAPMGEAEGAIGRGETDSAGPVIDAAAEVVARPAAAPVFGTASEGDVRAALANIEMRLGASEEAAAAAVEQVVTDLKLSTIYPDPPLPAPLPAQTLAAMIEGIYKSTETARGSGRRKGGKR
jgi:hypothetical protein